MSWPDARDRIIAIVEGTTPTTRKRGMPDKFKHIPSATPDAGNDSRTFAIVIKSMAMKGHISVSLPRWERFAIDVVVAYRGDIDPTALYEVIAADHLALVQRLGNASLWAQPSSTIESLFLGDELIGSAEIVEDEGMMFVSYAARLEFRST